MRTVKTPERVSALMYRPWKALPAWLVDGELWCLLLVGLLMLLHP
ncbi:MAG TPA: hypothetical protein PKE21_03725 [Flavobacteriales bacterium]|nr:hypothetical protein [Flavobacteriales bacterium]HMR26565.1 hypothetical protein [Flavobacteriales bacterium]